MKNSEYFNRTKHQEHSAENVEEVAEQTWGAVVVGEFPQVSLPYLPGHEDFLVGVVDPFAYGYQHATEGDLDQGEVGDNLDIDGESENEKCGAEYEHGLVPIVKNKGGQRVLFVPDEGHYWRLKEVE